MFKNIKLFPMSNALTNGRDKSIHNSRSAMLFFYFSYIPVKLYLYFANLFSYFANLFYCFIVKLARINANYFLVINLSLKALIFKVGFKAIINSNLNDINCFYYKTLIIYLFCLLIIILQIYLIKIWNNNINTKKRLIISFIILSLFTLFSLYVNYKYNEISNYFIYLGCIFADLSLFGNIKPLNISGNSNSDYSASNESSSDEKPVNKDKQKNKYRKDKHDNNQSSSDEKPNKNYKPIKSGKTYVNTGSSNPVCSDTSSSSSKPSWASSASMGFTEAKDILRSVTPLLIEPKVLTKVLAPYYLTPKEQIDIMADNFYIGPFYSKYPYEGSNKCPSWCDISLVPVSRAQPGCLVYSPEDVVIRPPSPASRSSTPPNPYAPGQY